MATRRGDSGDRTRRTDPDAVVDADARSSMPAGPFSTTRSVARAAGKVLL
ncbi:hypothetical protein [Haloplanus salinus]|nr:hypothetical protein [Haloplanus salinus]